MHRRSYQFRLYPSRFQEQQLTEMLGDFADLYNAALEERIGAWRSCRKSVTLREQKLSLTEIRRASPDWMGRWSCSAQQQVLIRLDRAFKGFFRSGRGFPRYRSKRRFNTAIFHFGDGLTRPRSTSILIKGVTGKVRFRNHRPIPVVSQIKTATVARRAGQWFISFQLVAELNEICGSGEVGVDLGLTSLVAESNGALTPAFRFARTASKRIARLQRELARKKRGSRRRERARQRLARAHRKVARQRSDAAHKLSRRLVRGNRLIAFEDLSVHRMVKGRFARSIYDAAWTQLVTFTRYKAESAGAEVILVDPRGTSQTCPSCGAVERKPLGLRRHVCPCGADLDRDVSAAQVVLQRATKESKGLLETCKR